MQDCSDYDCFDWRFRLDKIRISLIGSPISDDLVRLIVQSYITISDDKYDSLIQFALSDSRFVRFSDLFLQSNNSVSWFVVSDG